MRDWVHDPIRDGRGFEAYAAFTADPLAIVAEAERSLRNEPGSTLADFYADYAVTHASVNAEDEDGTVRRSRPAEIHFRAARGRGASRAPPSAARDEQGSAV
jgi:hypothetical protein